MTPEATSREALYIETGLLDIEIIIHIKRMNMLARLKKEKSILMTEVLSNPDRKWMKKTKEIMNDYSIQDEELTGCRDEVRNDIHVGMYVKFYEKNDPGKNKKSKWNFFLYGKTSWTPEKQAEYMLKLTRKEVRSIFKARTRMTKVKGNYKNGYPDQKCRACKSMDESQYHVLNECPTLHHNTTRRPGYEVPRLLRPRQHGHAVQ